MKRKLNCILVIDDDEPTNFLNNMLLEESGKCALACLSKAAISGSGETGLFYPELIFLYINMPAMNGWGFLEAYRQLKNNLRAATQIIMLTTSLNPGDKINYEGIPLVAGFENKPLTGSMGEKILKKYFSDNQH